MGLAPHGLKNKKIFLILWGIIMELKLVTKNSV